MQYNTERMLKRNDLEENHRNDDGTGKDGSWGGKGQKKRNKKETTKATKTTTTSTGMTRSRVAAGIAYRSVSPKATEPLILIIGYSLGSPLVCRGAQLRGAAAVYRYTRTVAPALYLSSSLSIPFTV